MVSGKKVRGGSVTESEPESEPGEDDEVMASGRLRGEERQPDIAVNAAAAPRPRRARQQQPRQQRECSPSSNGDREDGSTPGQSNGAHDWHKQRWEALYSSCLVF